MKVYIIIWVRTPPDRPLIWGVYGDRETAREVCDDLSEGTPFRDHSYKLTVHYVQ